MKWLPAPALALAWCVAALTLAAAPGPPTQALAVGSLVKSAFIAPDGRVVTVVAAVFPRELVTLRVVDRPHGDVVGETVRRALQHDVLAAINGGYFTPNYVPDGLLEVDGVVRQPMRAGLSGIVGRGADGAPVVVPAQGADLRQLRDAIQSGPFIVDPGGLGGIRRDDGKRARRSFVVLSDDSIVVAITSRCGLYELATALLANPRAFGVDRVERALNLDGGPSSGFAVRLHNGDVDVVPETVRLRTVLTIEPRPRS